MSKLSQTHKLIAVHDNALAFTCERVRAVQDGGIQWCGQSLRWFEQDASLKGWREVLKRLAVLDARMIHDLTQYARAGWGLADDALCELDTEYGHHHTAKPIALEVYLTDRRLYGRPKRVSSAQPQSNFLRNIAIACIIAEVCARFGLKPTRTSATRPSGCSVVTEALHIERVSTIDEPAVVSIWTHLGRIAFPGGLDGWRSRLRAA